MPVTRSEPPLRQSSRASWSSRGTQRRSGSECHRKHLRLLDTPYQPSGLCPRTLFFLHDEALRGVRAPPACLELPEGQRETSRVQLGIPAAAIPSLLSVQSLTASLHKHLIWLHGLPKPGREPTHGGCAPLIVRGYASRSARFLKHPTARPSVARGALRGRIVGRHEDLFEFRTSSGKSCPRETTRASCFS
jgi:hypothetical protein